MKHFLWVIILLSISLTAEAGEFRGGLGCYLGGSTLEDDFGDELSGDVSQFDFYGKYYLGEAGPYFGLSIGQAEAGDYELNGSPLSIPDQESDTASLAIGYRFGKYGDPQLFISAAFLRMDSDEGDDQDTKSFFVGVEKSINKGRYSLSAGYSSGDDIDTYGVGVTGIVYLTEIIGLGAGANYSIGDGKLFGADVDVSSWVVGINIEFRFLH